VVSRIEVGAGRAERFKGVRDPVMVYRLLAIADEVGRSGAEARMTHLDAVD